MTIDITPKWEGLVPILLRLYRDTDKDSVREEIEESFLEIARFVDQHNAEAKLAHDGMQG